MLADSGALATRKTCTFEVWTLDTSATLTKDVVPVGIGFSNGELVEALRLEDSRGFSMENPESKVGRTMSEHEKEPHIFRWK